MSEREPSAADLTPSELDVLRCYALTSNRKQAAVMRGVSRHTVQRQLCSAYAKLGVTSAFEAFVALGWLRIP